MSYLSKLSLWIVAGALSASAWAQSTKPTLPAPLIEAVKKAVGSNPEVQAAYNGFLAADSQRDIAKAGFLPQIDLSASTGTENRVTPTVNFGNYNVNSAQLTLNQILFDGLFTVNEVSRLGAAKLTRYYELLAASETAALEAMRAYADVVRYRELVESATQNYVEHKQSTVLVEERANSGVGRRVDVEQANGRLALAESNLLTELTNLHDVSARYLRVVGEKPPASLAPLPEPFRVGALPTTIDVLMRDGLQNNPTLLAAVQNARASRLAVDSAKAAFMPRLDLQLYGSQSTNASGVAGDTRATGAALALSYNLFKGGADMARQRQTVKLAEQARDLQEKACRDVRQTLSLAYSDVRALNEQLGYIDRHRLASEKTREAYRQQFDIGQRTLLDLLDTQNEFFEATRSYINSRHDQAAAQARTLAGMGQLVAALGASRSDVPSARDAGLDGAAIDPKEICPMEEVVVDTLEKIKAEIVLPARTKPEVAPVAAAKGCGRVVLLPDENGKVGEVTVKGDKAGEVKLDKAYAAASDGCDNVVATVVKPEDIKVPPVPAAARFFRVNFELGKTTMVPESAAVFKAVLEDYRKAGVPAVMIIGHADKVGTAAGNLALSKARAEVIKARLIKEGNVPAADIGFAWRGDKDPIPGTENNKVEPRNRRVEIRVQ